MKSVFSNLVASVLLLGAVLLPSPAPAENPSIPWDIAELQRPPRSEPAPGLESEGVRAVFFEGGAWKGKPTRVFAYIGLPEHKAGEKVPGMVLVHGGGGTAFPEWVRMWNARGYAAIAMDTCGTTAGGENGKHPRHEQGGPPGWGGFGQIDEPVADQWTYHAVADVILAHSLLRSLPEVDAERTGLTGISWGGYLTCIAAGVDERFRLAAPVYGCGFLGDNSAWLPDFQKMGAEKAGKWLRLWDPSSYLPLAKMPMLWVTGTNDFAYPFDSLQKSYRLPKGERNLCIRVRMPHGHPAGQTPQEIFAFADSVLLKKPSLPRITWQVRNGAKLSLKWESPSPIVKAELNFTKDSGPWKDRKWETVPATLDVPARAVDADIPGGATVVYINLTDEKGLVASSEHVVISEGAAAP